MISAATTHKGTNNKETSSKGHSDSSKRSSNSNFSDLLLSTKDETRSRLPVFDLCLALTKSMERGATKQRPCSSSTRNKALSSENLESLDRGSLYDGVFLQEHVKLTFGKTSEMEQQKPIGRDNNRLEHQRKIKKKLTRRSRETLKSNSEAPIPKFIQIIKDKMHRDPIDLDKRRHNNNANSKNKTKKEAKDQYLPPLTDLALSMSNNLDQAISNGAFSPNIPAVTDTTRARLRMIYKNRKVKRRQSCTMINDNNESK